MIFGREPALWLGFIQVTIALVVGFGLHLTGEQVSLTMAFFGGLFALITRGTSTSNAKLKDNGVEHAALRLLPFAIAGALLLSAAAPARAADAPRFVSLQRLGGGVVAQASVYSNALSSGNPAPVSTFAPKAYLSYSLLDEVSAHASAQFGVGGVRINELHAGGAVRILREDSVRVSVGVDAVRYTGPDASRFAYRDVVEYSLRASKVLKRTRGAPRLGIQFQPAWVPLNRNFVYRLGINAPLFGGEGVIQ